MKNPEDHVFIIAEAGVNHNGDLELAKKLIDAAAAAGADAVKFQTFKAESLVARDAPKAAYQQRNSGGEESQYEMLKRLELSEEQFVVLHGYCQSQGIEFLSTAFDLKSVDFLASLGLEIFKIPSGEITNLPYLRKVGGLGKKIILSTGMADLEEVEAALAALEQAGTTREGITVLQCTTEYPTPMAEVNLRAMATIARQCRVAVGFSDHTEGIEAAIAAAALGAKVVEKHFTLDKTLPGPDHKASLEPDELRAMVRAIRNIEKALGDGIKRPGPSELPNRTVARKSIVAARDIKKGEQFTAKNLTVKRPGGGISPMRWDEMLGQTAGRDFDQDELITLIKE
ncbi:N-acetylneuraminate synthase [Desulfurivibrio dismutans]|uniref:N-acetylneuraminate synthase n=1 Tax=Desulfurivibrio dismutans TaxID=1398908 RepID=UPI0023DA781F|nr:N-acetylneuraminate synthase [Desulfurivibrio alkaliphilus]MDF1613504.1 N-acetylneuraminate synthase [Desulfurivibrio alkaliphilus]